MTRVKTQILLTSVFSQPEKQKAYYSQEHCMTLTVA